MTTKASAQKLEMLEDVLFAHFLWKSLEVTTLSREPPNCYLPVVSVKLYP